MLAPAEELAQGVANCPEYPCLFIIGNSRCGSTFLLQWLASLNLFCYPTNLLSRFYMAPYIGSKIQQMLTEEIYNHKDEFKDISKKISLDSDKGKTEGLLSTHEFWHFWRRFIPTYYIEKIPAKSENQIDVKGLRNGIALIQKSFKKPIAMKGKMFNFNISKLHEIFPNALFIYLQRDPVMVAQSIYIARKINGEKNSWFGVRPPEYKDLINRNIYDQISGQIYYTDRHIVKQIYQMPKNNVLSLKYEDLCEDPKRVYEKLKKSLKDLGFAFSKKYDGPSKFCCSNNIKIPQKEFDRIKESVNVLY